MITPLSALLFASVAFALPILNDRKVDSLNEAATKEAQVRDDTATRAFSSINIKTSDGQCVFVDELSGDFRANLLPIQVGACDGSAGQKWDIITAGKHNDQPGTMLVVSALTQGCMNFDPRRAAGNQALIFSCGGRADGGGDVTNSQLFTFNAGSTTTSLAVVGQKGTCFTVAGAVLDGAACNAGNAKQTFTFGDAGSTPSKAPESPQPPVIAKPAAESGTCISTSIVTSTTVVTRFVDVTRSPTTPTESPEILAPEGSPSSPVVTAAPNSEPPVSENPTTPVPVSRAGGVLQPSAAAEANKRDNTATRALTGVQIKDATGKCLFIDPTAGDFRQNLIPIAVRDCTGSAGEKFDFITKGVHNDQAGQTLLVSSLTNGCVNIDTRRAAGDQVILFSCGGRGDGSGAVNNSQLFAFKEGETSLALASDAGKTCLVNNNGKLDQTACSGAASQRFTVG